MLSEDQLTKASFELCRIRGTKDVRSARMEILRLQEIYQAITFAKGDNSSPLKGNHMTIEMKPVVSSNIAAMGHDPETSTLRVQFTSNSTYEYSNVPASVYADILNASSIGSAFSKLVKSQPTTYPFRKVS